MNESEAKQIAELLGPESWKLTPATFLNYVTQGKWIATPHLLYISSLIASRVAQGNGRLIVSIPPRHGKSELLSVGTPQWFLEKYPHRNVILTSHTAELSSDFSRRVRDELRGRKDLLTVRIRPDVSRMAHFMTTMGGSLFSAGVGGPITGRGAHLLIVDDYIKTAEEAESTTIRKKINDWFKSVALTRLEPGGTAVILATRWNKYDLIGELLGEQDPDSAPGIGYESIDILSEEEKQQLALKETQQQQLDGSTLTFFGEEWEYVELGAQAHPGDPLGREVGEPLWPERYDQNILTKRKHTLGKYFWNALYQQRPISRSDWAFDKSDLKFISPNQVPSHSKVRWVRAWDFASSEEKGADYTVGVLMCIDTTNDIDASTYIVDVVRGQWSPASVERILQRTAKRDGQKTEIFLEQEPGSAGKIMADQFKRTLLRGYQVVAERPTGPKHIRSNLLYAALEDKRIIFVKASWNKTLLDELEDFPEGVYDDQVDACAYAYNALNGPRTLSPVLYNHYGSTLPPTMIDENSIEASHMLTGAAFGHLRASRLSISALKRIQH